LKALNDPDVRTRVRAVRSLKDRETPEAVDLLSKFLKDRDRVVVKAVIDTLGHLGLKSHLKDAVFNILAQKAVDKSFSHPSDALTMAAVIGKERLLPVISDLVLDENVSENEKDSAVRALSLIGGLKCIPLLEKLLSIKTDDPTVHQTAFDTLASIGTPEALALLQEHVAFSDDIDQTTSALALARLNRPEFNHMLSNELRDGVFEEDTIAELATSPAAPEIFGELLRATPEKEKQISWLRKLSQYASSAKQEVRSGLASAVAPLLDSNDTEIQIEAIKTIGQIGGDDASESLIEKLDSNEPIVRREAVIAMWPYATSENYKPLLDMVWDEDQETRRYALVLAEPFIKETDRPILEKAVEHPDEIVRKQVKMILKLMDLDKRWEENDVS
jgi:HEAT repeat protein